MNPPAKLTDLIDALESVSEEVVSRFDRQTGKMVYVERWILRAMEEGRENELGALPKWQEQESGIARAIAEDRVERFLEGPDKFDFHEYGQREQFIARQTNDPPS